MQEHRWTAAKGHLKIVIGDMQLQKISYIGKLAATEERLGLPPPRFNYRVQNIATELRKLR